MQMNLNMWGKEIKETISKHDRHETVSWLYIHPKKKKKLNWNQLETIEKPSEVADIQPTAYLPTQCYLNMWCGLHVGSSITRLRNIFGRFQYL